MRGYRPQSVQWAPSAPPSQIGQLQGIQNIPQAEAGLVALPLETESSKMSIIAVVS
jgi:hypothetical protein